jgi:hypothetical protein
MMTNELYLAVLPLIHPSGVEWILGRTEEVVTLFPDKRFATGFFPDEVDKYIAIFQMHAASHLTGGHVRAYRCVKEPSAEGAGRMIVKVMQDVA